MLRNRLIFTFLILAAAAFSSFYGGTSYLLLFAVLLLPLVSFLCLVIAFASLKLSQGVKDHILYKGEETSYRFVLRNRGPFICTGVELRLYTSLFEAKELEPFQFVSLPPGDRIETTARIRCLYRGTYQIGVESIAATDFLNLFRLKRSARTSQATVQVLPRVIRLKRLASAPDEEDTKNFSVPSVRVQEQPDVESRPYTAGDGLRTVNWKLSARQQELLVRKYTGRPKLKILLAVDLSEIKLKKPLDRIITEDKIIETALSAADHFLRRHVPLEVSYCAEDSLCSGFKLETQAAFDQLYRVFSGVPFSAASSFPALLEQIAFENGGQAFCIVVTHRLDEALCRSASRILPMNGGVSIIQVGGKPAQEIPPNLDRRVRLVRITQDEGIADALETIQGEWR